MLNTNANCYNIENNFKYNTVISTFSDHILIFKTLSIDIDILISTTIQKIKRKMANFFFIKFFFLIFLRKTTLESKVTPTNSNSSAYLLHTSQTFCNVELYSNFSQYFLELIAKIKTMLLKQSIVLFTNCHKILRILCVNT